jgi:hypothetical protein
MSDLRNINGSIHAAATHHLSIIYVSISHHLRIIYAAFKHHYSVFTQYLLIIYANHGRFTKLHAAITHYLRRTVTIYAEYTQYLRRTIIIYAVFTRCVNSTTPTTPGRKFCVNTYLHMILRIYAQSSLLSLCGLGMAVAGGTVLQLAGRGTEERTPTRMVLFPGFFYLENYDVS